MDANHISERVAVTRQEISVLKVINARHWVGQISSRSTAGATSWGSSRNCRTCWDFVPSHSCDLFHGA